MSNALSTIPWPDIVLLTTLFIAAYFLIIKPKSQQEKQLQDLQTSIKPGDEILTSSGILGKVIRASEDSVQINIGANNTLTIMKHAITEKLAKGTLKKHRL